MTGVPRPEAAAARGGVLARLEAGLVRANRWVVIALVAVMAVLVFANVVARYAFSYSFVWAEEVTRYMMVWVGFIGSGLVLRYGAHIAVEAFQDVLPARAAQATRALVVLILAVSFAAMTWLGVQYVLFAWDQETPILNWNFGLVYLAGRQIYFVGYVRDPKSRGLGFVMTVVPGAIFLVNAAAGAIAMLR